MVNLKDLWIYRELLYFLTWREIKVRYKQTVLGFAWAIIQPFFMMIVFTLFFGNLAQVPSEGIPYPLFNYAALLPWTLFAEGLSRTPTSSGRYISPGWSCRYPASFPRWSILLLPLPF
jgi:lipopolysaccharide transport system permease protein